MSYTLAVFLLSFADPAIHARGESMLSRLSEDYSLTGKVTR
jgi:hypothetical protein